MSPALRSRDGVALGHDWHRADDPVAGAVVCHPHPLYGGDRHNAVVVALARALPVAGVTALRFDFRGGGTSEGEHGGGRAERDDVLGALDAMAAEIDGPLFGVGYSFGADVLLATDDHRWRGTVAVAPPLAVLPLPDLAAARGRGPTLVLAPAHDQFCPPDVAAERTEGWPATEVEAVEGGDHFLAGRTSAVADRAVAAITSWLALPSP